MEANSAMIITRESEHHRRIFILLSVRYLVRGGEERKRAVAERESVVHGSFCWAPSLARQELCPCDN